MPDNENPDAAARRNVKLVLEYDGTGFAGWQRQPARRTVQQAVEEAVARVTGERVTVLASGRTDSGVHAEGQTANFRTNSLLPPERLMGALNANLPEDVAVVGAEDVPATFHATLHARSKTYRYRISTRSVRPVFDRHRMLWLPRPLDVERMKRAAAYLVGRHDFNSFRAEGSVEKNTVRTIDEIEFDETEGELAVYFRGRGFLYMMIRIIMGTLIRVGLGRIDPDSMPAILEAKDRRAAGPTAAAHALTLVEVKY